jgi:hypothetical protein
VANNYTQTSFVIPLTPEQQGFLIERLDAENEDGNCSGASAQRGEAEIWIYSEESIDLDLTALAIQETLSRFNLGLEVFFTWADTCSKMRVDEFSGGGVRITKGDIDWYVPYYLMRKQYP